MRVAQAENLSGIDSVELGDQPDPAPAAGQALIRVYGAGVGPWDVGFLSGGFPGIVLPFVPGQEVAGVVEAAGEGAGVQPEDRVMIPPWSRRSSLGWVRKPRLYPSSYL
jgi:NADPH:quinone reductase-like Zn-dependent oxidoreductase